MTDETMQRTNIYLADVDREATQVVMAEYGLTSTSAAIRIALRNEAKRIASMKKQESKDV